MQLGTATSPIALPPRRAWSARPAANSLGSNSLGWGIEPTPGDEEIPSSLQDSPVEAEGADAGADPEEHGADSGVVDVGAVDVGEMAAAWDIDATEAAVAAELHEAQAQADAAGEHPEPPQDFEQLFREYERYVASIGNRILGANNGVDDLVQDVFLVIYQEFHKLRDLSSVKGWLATITTRLAWRQLGRPWLYTKLSVNQMEELSPMESPDASPETKADLAALIRRLNSLAPVLRKPWVLRYIDGETLPRIAELCECSQSTVQRRLREAGEVMLTPRAVLP